MVTIDMLRSRSVPMVIAYGGGVNSLALLLTCIEQGIRPDHITFADTGGEKPGTYQHMQEVVAPYLQRVGYPAITRVALHKPIAGDKTLEEQCLRLGTLPSRAYGHGTCAIRWKVEPQDVFLKRTYPERCARITAIKNALRPGVKAPVATRLMLLGLASTQEALDELRGLRILKTLGYDGGEERRATIHEDTYCRLAFPLMELEIDREGCLAKIDAHGLARPPKSACFFCPSSRKEEVLALAAQHPDLFARAVEMERRADESDKSTTVVGLGRHWSWSELVRLDPRKRAALPDRPVESCGVCTDGEE